MKGHILITGSSGFIGKNLVYILSRSGYTITSVSRSMSNQEHSFSIDLTSLKETYKFINNINKVDAIIHCAAIAHGQNPPKGFTISKFNSLILNNLISAFKEKQPHWIFLSSISVYGKTDSEIPIQLTKTPIPSNDYGYGKLNDENTLISKCTNLDILRLMPVYDKDNLEDIKKRVYIPKTNLRFKLLPSPKYSLCHISQVSGAILNCLKKSDGKKIHHIADEEPTSQNLLANQFSGLCIVIPQFFFKILLFVIPSKVAFFNNLYFMLKKLSLNNLYERGNINIK